MSSRYFDFRLALGIPLLLMALLLTFDPSQVDFALARLFYEPGQGFIGRSSFWLEDILHDRAKQALILLGVLAIAGFACIMANFQSERLSLAIMANMTAQLALEESMKWARERQAFGKPVGRFQVLKHRLAEMATQLEVSREFTYRQAAQMATGRSVIKEISMAKNFATDIADRLTYDAVQIMGGMGYMRESLVERLYRDNRILSIGGGTREIMNEIIAKQMGL